MTNADIITLAQNLEAVAACVSKLVDRIERLEHRDTSEAESIAAVQDPPRRRPQPASRPSGMTIGRENGQPVPDIREIQGWCGGMVKVLELGNAQIFYNASQDEIRMPVNRGASNRAGRKLLGDVFICEGSSRLPDAEIERVVL